MILKTERMVLRAAQRGDEEAIHRWENDPSHWLVSNREAPISKEEILSFIDLGEDIFTARQFRWMMILGNVAVGCIDLYDFDPKNARVGLGILVDPDFRGQGFGQEALASIIAYCFESLEVVCVFAEVLASNESSNRLFTSLGFERTGTRKSWLWDGFVYQDQHFYQILRPR